MGKSPCIFCNAPEIREKITIGCNRSIRVFPVNSIEYIERSMFGIQKSLDSLQRIKDRYTYCRLNFNDIPPEDGFKDMSPIFTIPAFNIKTIGYDYLNQICIGIFKDVLSYIFEVEHSGNRFNLR